MQEDFKVEGRERKGGGREEGGWKEDEKKDEGKDERKNERGIGEREECTQLVIMK